MRCDMIWQFSVGCNKQLNNYRIEIYIKQDMIDKVLGFDQPPPRRRKPDNASESSSKVSGAVPVESSPARPPIRKINTEDYAASQAQNQDAEEAPVVTQSVNRPKPKLAAGKTDPKPEAVRTPSKVESQEEISSPAVKHISVAQLPRANPEMRNSGKYQMRESMRASSLQRAPPQDDTMYKVKLLIFIIVSIALTLYAMTPSRKTSSRRK